LLQEFKIDCLGYVIQIGKIKAKENSASLKQKREFLENSFLNCLDIKAEELMKKEIIKAGKNGNTLGGILKVEAEGVPPGLGSYAQADRKLNVRLAKALMSIPSVKGVEIGEGFNLTNFTGSEIQDEIYWKNGYKRKTNYAGGIEGGISNGEKILLQAVMKPIPTLKSSLNSINIITKEKTPAPYLRSDVCVLPSGSVIAESMLALEIACAFCEKFYADHLNDMRSNYQNYLKRIKF
ncbi:MAG: chorismate synthase, partial [Armatimonadetes bacterium]|nr:chorismate synthase [Armatimonadota bacterium]